MAEVADAKKIVERVLSGEKHEDQDIDFVCSLDNKASVGQKVAAFGTSGGGYLVIGIDDKDKHICDIGDEQSAITRVGEVLRLCEPIPQCDGPTFTSVDGKKVAVLHIIGVGTVCFYDKTAYRRVQDSCVRMSPHDIYEVWSHQGKISWETRQSPATIEAIDQTEVEFYLNATVERGEANQEEFLIHKKAVTTDRKYLTNLGLISIARQPEKFVPHLPVQLIRFRGNEPIQRVAAAAIGGPLRRVLENAENFIRLNTPIREKFIGTKRVEELIIPDVALREALVNTLAHRDYEDPQDVIVRVFDDRIEFQNPGAPSQELLEKILKHGTIIHKNPGLYQFLRPMHKGEGAGQGIPLMRDAMRKAGLVPPQISAWGNIFTVVLYYRPIGQQDTFILRTAQILEKEKQITSTDLMKFLQISRPAALKILNGLVVQGLAQHVGNRRSSKYEWVQDTK